MLWLLHMNDTGIIIQGSYNTLENSEIGYSAGNGVMLEGDNTSLITGNVVTNNVIHDVDYMSLDCAGSTRATTGLRNGGGTRPQPPPSTRSATTRSTTAAAA